MEYVESQTLRERIAKGPVPSPTRDRVGPGDSRGSSRRPNEIFPGLSMRPHPRHRAD
jgi:hypothetical protein